MNQEHKIIEVLRDFETFKMSEIEQGVYAHTYGLQLFVERIKALLIHNVVVPKGTFYCNEGNDNDHPCRSQCAWCLNKARDKQ